MNETFRYDELEFVLSTNEANVRQKQLQYSETVKRTGRFENTERNEEPRLTERFLTDEVGTHLESESSRRERRPDSQRARLIQAKKIEKQMQ